MVEEEAEEEEPRPPPRVGLFAPAEAKLTVRWAPTEAPAEAPVEAAAQQPEEEETGREASRAGDGEVGDSAEEKPSLPAAPPAAAPSSVMLHPPEVVRLSSCAAGGN